MCKSGGTNDGQKEELAEQAGLNESRRGRRRRLLLLLVRAHPGLELVRGSEGVLRSQRAPSGFSEAAMSVQVFAEAFQHLYGVRKESLSRGTFWRPFPECLWSLFSKSSSGLPAESLSTPHFFFFFFFFWLHRPGSLLLLVSLNVILFLQVSDPLPAVSLRSTSGVPLQSLRMSRPESSSGIYPESSIKIPFRSPFGVQDNVPTRLLENQRHVASQRSPLPTAPTGRR